jgi:hypothetical protein
MHYIVIDSRRTDLFSTIFDLTVEENAIWYGVVSALCAIILTLACQNRSKNLRNRYVFESSRCSVVIPFLISHFQAHCIARSRA